MTVLTAHRSHPDARTSRPRLSRRALAAGAAGVLIVSGIAAFTLSRDGGSTASGTDVLDARRVVATQAACQQWVASPGAPGGLASSGWCTGMTGWMTTRLAQDPTMASSMWDSPQAMLAACHQWASAAATPVAGCDQMVGWMSATMGSWNGAQAWDAHMDGWRDGMMGR